MTRTYDSAPSSLPLYLKAALPAFPLVGGLPGIRHATGVVPDLRLARRSVLTDPAHLEAYNRVCGFAPASMLPATYPHLAAFGLHLALMTDTAFPLAPMGLVHLRNTITQHRPISVGQPFDVEVHARDLRPHPKGTLVDIVTEVSVDDAIVWEEKSTLFARGEGAAKELTPGPLDGVEAARGVVHWRAPADLGRRYAAVSGDRNPIHLYALSARAFGFTHQIAHGMWTKARALAALQRKLPSGYRVDVEFRKPILLPATVVFGSATSAAGLDFGVMAEKKRATHLVGRVTTDL